MSVRIVEPEELQRALFAALRRAPIRSIDFVTGPGRSGAIAAAFASHILGLPFVPYKQMVGKRVLIVDTAALTGRTIRKASRLYHDAPTVVAFQQPPRVKFWYERPSLARGKGREYARPQPWQDRPPAPHPADSARVSGDTTTTISGSIAGPVRTVF